MERYRKFKLNTLTANAAKFADEADAGPGGDAGGGA